MILRRPRLLALALLALAGLGACAGAGGRDTVSSVPTDEEYRRIGADYADAILFGMERTRLLREGRLPRAAAGWPD